MASHDLADAWHTAQQHQDHHPQPEQQQQQPEQASTPTNLSPGFTAAEALATHESKSFDYRLLHLLLHKLLGQPWDEPLLSFMVVDERLVDISDDLTDYEDDVVANSFNVYRGEGG
jgi:hypothetical protein